MPILNNAISSIQIGIEDYNCIDKDRRRILSSIRNIYSGILLLFKYKLQQISPDDSNDVLIKSKITPQINAKTGLLSWIGTGKKTIDVQEIKNRFKALGISYNEEYLTTLQKIRNDIEHSFTEETESQLKEVITKSFHLIIDFWDKLDLDIQPVELLGNECYRIMLNISTIYDEERKKCLDNLKNFPWKYKQVKNSIDKLKCPSCDSELIKIVDYQEENPNFLCMACGDESSYLDVIGSSIYEALEGNSFHNITQGGNPETDTCHWCNNASFSFIEGCCLACHTELSHKVCQYCGEQLSTSEQDLGGICSSCSRGIEKGIKE